MFSSTVYHDTSPTLSHISHNTLAAVSLWFPQLSANYVESNQSVSATHITMFFLHLEIRSQLICGTVTQTLLCVM